MWTSSSITMNDSTFTSIFNTNIGLPTNGSTSSSLSPIFESFCENLQTIGGAYNVAHGYASLTVCLFGTLANILNLIILTRKEMVNSTNIILTGLAFADLLTTVEYVPYAIYTDFLPDPVNGKRRKTYLWALYVLIHSNFSQVCHTIAIWLTVTVAVWRYVMISMPLQCKTVCSIKRAKWMLILSYVMSPLLCIPIYLAFSIKAVTPSDPGIEPPNVAVILHHHPTNNNITSTILTSSSERLKYIVNLSDLAQNNKLIVTINFWVYSVVIKIIPCILLTVVSLRLISSLIKVNKRKKMLLHGLSSSKKPISCNSSRVQAENQQSQISSHFTHEHPPLLEEAQQRHEHDNQQISLRDSNNDILKVAEIETTLSVAIVPEQESGRNLTGSSSSRYSSSEVCVTKRTTIMLLTVLILFLITEFPQGVLALFSDLMGDKFFKRCYIPMANLMDFLALFNAALNFLLYVATSIRFRNTFLRILNTLR